VTYGTGHFGFARRIIRAQPRRVPNWTWTVRASCSWFSIRSSCSSGEGQGASAGPNSLPTAASPAIFSATLRRRRSCCAPAPRRPREPADRASAELRSSKYAFSTHFPVVRAHRGLACSTSASSPPYSWHGALLWHGVISRPPPARVRRTVPQLNHGLLNQPSRKAEHDDHGPNAANRQPRQGAYTSGRGISMTLSIGFLACGRRRSGIEMPISYQCLANAQLRWRKRENAIIAFLADLISGHRFSRLLVMSRRAWRRN